MAGGVVLRAAPRGYHPPGRPRRDRAVSDRKRRRAVPSVAHCPRTRAPSVPPPDTVSVSPPPHSGPALGAGPGPQALPGRRWESPRVGRGARGRTSPHLAPEVGRRRSHQSGAPHSARCPPGAPRGGVPAGAHQDRPVAVRRARRGAGSTSPLPGVSPGPPRPAVRLLAKPALYLKPQPRRARARAQARPFEAQGRLIKAWAPTDGHASHPAPEALRAVQW